MKRIHIKCFGIVLLFTLFLSASGSVKASGQGEEVLALYQQYREQFEQIACVDDIEANGYEIDNKQMFPVLLESFGDVEVLFLSARDKTYHRLALFVADGQGNILYKTHELETNYVCRGTMEQPNEKLASVSFQDVNYDGLKDIILISQCVNESGAYAGKAYKVGDVLFQRQGSFYRDWRISDKINRFGMNMSASCIISFVRDGNSTEFLYTATTLEELLDNGFTIIEEQAYTRNFEKMGRLRTVPGVFHISEYDIFMIYLVDNQGDIVWSFQPMKDYDNLYALKGVTGKDVDGDGMKDLVVLARYSREDREGNPEVVTDCAIYYQRTGMFETDVNFADFYTCTETDTLEALIVKIREYWGWKAEDK